MAERRTIGFVALTAALGFGVLVFPSAAPVLWGMIGAASTAAVGYGLRRHRPARPAPWLLFGAGLAVLAAGDVTYAVVSAGVGRDAGLVAEWFYVGNFPLLAAGLVQLTRRSAVLRDRSGLTDLLAVVLALGLVGWTQLVAPALPGSGLSPVEQCLLASHILGDLLALVVMLWLAVAAPRNASVLLLTVGVAGLLTADIAYAIARVGPGWYPGGPAELGYLVFYLSWGAAALQPSMTRLTERAEPASEETAATRVGLVALTSLAAPVVLLIEAAAGVVVHGVMIAVVAGFTTTLVVVRVVDARNKHRQALRRERHLRETCTSLVAATGSAQVGEALRALVTQVMPDGTPHRIVFALYRPGPRAGDLDFAWSPRVELDHPLPTEGSRRRSLLVETRLLPSVLIEPLGGLPATIVASLAPGAEPVVGGADAALLVAADRDVLVASRDVIEVAAGQATLALYRIEVTGAANRRDREHYLDLTAGSTTDGVLIVGDDDRVGYANPAIWRILGIESRVFATWRDIVHPDDHEQVERTLRAVRAAVDPPGLGVQWTLRRADGSRVVVEVDCRPLGAEPGPPGVAVTVRDVTDERRREWDQLRRRLETTAPGLNRRSLRRRFR
ncbi:PAS domain-containing protein [Micromonospora sp. NPDC050417]|uniref:PAS domain-containing protein n=1 Tax=Micromonospora sp. NPDC050417 TaxID=3364280 RepID=UPI00378A547F